MIEARLAHGVDRLGARLARKAGALAAAAIAARRSSARGDPDRWRSARLLWPLFTKD